MLTDLIITRTTQSRLASVDFDKLGFGDVFSDHMFSMVYEDGAWQRPEILPYGPVLVPPANAALHYGQAVFEGLKGFMGPDGTVRVFRPDRNVRRLADSCQRMCIPMIEEEIFYAAFERLIGLDHAWIPRTRGQALYIRPLIFATEQQIEVRPASSYRFLVMTGPVRAYFDGGMSAVALMVAEDHTRSSPRRHRRCQDRGKLRRESVPGGSGASQRIRAGVVARWRRASLRGRGGGDEHLLPHRWHRCHPGASRHHLARRHPRQCAHPTARCRASGGRASRRDRRDHRGDRRRSFCRKPSVRVPPRSSRRLASSPIAARSSSSTTTRPAL